MCTVQYAIIGRHRLAWVNYSELVQSKADLMHFSMELSKKLDIWYRNPPLPVDLNVANSSNFHEAMRKVSEADLEMQPLVNHMDTTENSSLDLKDLQSKFRPKFDWQR